MVEPSHTSAAVLMVGIALSAYGILRQSEQRHRQRVADLREAVELLQIHVEALAEIMEHPDAPLVLKRTANETSIAFRDRDVARRLLDWLRAGGLAEQSDASNESAQMLQELRRAAPELVSAFARCIDSGFVAAVLGWPETADVWRAVSGRFVSVPDREIGLVRRLRKLSADGAMPSLPAFA